ncbi:hypothetical protein QTP88_002342 [Uroleucon formosanum]
MSSKVSFTVEDIKLVQCVREHPCLYDLKNANYKDQQIRDNVWKLISNNLNNKSEFLMRIRKLLKFYQKKMRMKKLLGVLKFLIYWIIGLIGLINFNSTHKMNDSEEDDSLTVTVDNENNFTDFSETELENNFNTGKTKLFKEKWPTKKVKQNEELVSLLKRSNDERQQILNSINKVEEDEDPIDAFFKTIALTVKSCPQRLKINSKKEVFDIITNLEIENESTTSISNINI